MIFTKEEYAYTFCFPGIFYVNVLNLYLVKSSYRLKIRKQFVVKNRSLLYAYISS